MARKASVNLSDTIETWRQKTNITSSIVGEPDNLTTTNKSDLVQAVNEINTLTGSSYVRGRISLSANNNANHASLSYNSATGIFSFASSPITNSDLPQIFASNILADSSASAFDISLIPNIPISKIIAGGQVFDSAVIPTLNTDLSGKSTSDLSEGTNQYFTNTRVRSAISLTSNSPSGSGSLTYTQGTGSFVYTPPAASSYGDASVDTHLNTSTAASSEVLSWNGSDYDWVAQSSGGAAGVDSATVIGLIDSTHIAGNAPAAGATSGSVITQKWSSQGADNIRTAIPSASFPTGIARKPDIVQGWLRCTTPQHGYDVGDEVQISQFEFRVGSGTFWTFISWDEVNDRILTHHGNKGTYGAGLQKNASNICSFSYTNWILCCQLSWFGIDSKAQSYTLNTAVQV